VSGGREAVIAEMRDHTRRMRWAGVESQHAELIEDWARRLGAAPSAPTGEREQAIREVVEMLRGKKWRGAHTDSVAELVEREFLGDREEKE
jgi:hypothetical protein